MVIKLRKSGKFYSVFDDDCYIIYYFFDYKIVNCRLGFPESALSKVINTLSENKINYEIIGSDEKENFKKVNKYNNFLKLGKEKYYKSIRFTNINDKLKDLTDEQLEKILMYIEEVINE